MIWFERRIKISHDLWTTASPIFGACRLFGLAPLSVEKTPTDLLVKWSLWLTLYSWTIGLASVVLMVYGVFQNDESPDEVNQSTTKYIKIVNWFVEQLAVVVGIFGAPFRFKNLCGFVEQVAEVDVLMPLSTTKKSRRATLASLVSMVTCNAIFLGTKCYTMAKNNFSLKDLMLPIHEAVSYLVVMVLECLYWYMTSTIKRRIGLFNQTLSRLRQGTKLTHYETEKALTSRQQIKILPVEEKDPKMHPESTSYTHATKLTQIYINLCNAVDELNETCGPFVSIIIVIDLLRLTVTGYLLIVSLQTDFDLADTLLITCTFLASFYRLVFIVEPCQDCVKQTKETSLLVCRLLCSDGFGSKQQLQVLYNQLLQRKIEFSACGFGNVDRTLITTISATATLYLVAAVQFKISED